MKKSYQEIRVDKGERSAKSDGGIKYYSISADGARVAVKKYLVDSLILAMFARVDGNEVFKGYVHGDDFHIKQDKKEENLFNKIVVLFDEKNKNETGLIVEIDNNIKRAYPLAEDTMETHQIFIYHEYTTWAEVIFYDSKGLNEVINLVIHKSNDNNTFKKTVFSHLYTIIGGKKDELNDFCEILFNKGYQETK